MEIISSPKKVVQYEPFILRISLPFFDVNPNDFSKVSVEAVITSPTKERNIVPFFCIANKKRTGISLWEARFTPVKKGRHEYYVQVGSDEVKEKSPKAFFQAEKGQEKGFLRKSKNNPYYLAFDSGEPFFGIGHNVAWVHKNSLPAFNKYFSSLEDNGCNLTRVWLCDWSFPIEWGTLGEYDQKFSLDLDKLIKLAKKRNIYIILCLDTYGSLMDEEGSWGEGRWEVNPYNAKNGGPCERAEDFFTNSEAKRWYKNKLRYIISRWGYSPNILAFELWNEYNAPKKWVREMATFIEENNPHGQLVTTSSGYPWGEIFDESEIWGLKEIDIISVHIYGSASGNGVSPNIMQKGREISAEYDKPFIISEFGIDYSKNDRHYDPKGEGVALHNSLWASLLSKSFGSAMNWWWDSYISPQNLYFHYRALAEFAEDIDWDSRKIKYAEVSPVRIGQPKGSRTKYKSVTVNPKDKWGKIHVNEFTFLKNGDLAGGGTPNKYLHGNAKKEFKVDYVYNVNYPAEGKFIINVDVVSQGGHLIAYLDGKKVMDREFPAGPGEGPWKRSLYRRDYNIYQAVYDEDIEINVPAGEHVIRLTNTGKDWIGLKRITLANYLDITTIANARSLGLVVGDRMLFWIQNKDSNWKNVFEGIKPKAIKDSYFDVLDIDNGIYGVEWWDTYSGKIIKREEIEAVENVLRLEVPRFLRDIACKIKKMR